MRADARRLQGDAVFRDRAAARARLVDQAVQRAVGRDQLGNAAPGEGRRAGGEELLGGQVDEGDGTVRRHHQHRLRQGVEHAFGVDPRRRQPPGSERALRAHAASRSMVGR